MWKSRCYGGVGEGSGAVKAQDSAAEIFLKDGLNRFGERGVPPSGRQYRQATPKFSLGQPIAKSGVPSALTNRIPGAFAEAKNRMNALTKAV